MNQGNTLTLARTCHFPILERTWGGWLPPPRAISFLLEIELSSKDQKDSLGRDESNDTQFYLLRSVIDLPGQVKLKNVAVLGHRWISSALLIIYR